MQVVINVRLDIYSHTTKVTSPNIHIYRLRCCSNEVVRIATDSIYIQKEALYKIEKVSVFFKQAKQKTSTCKGSHSKNSANISKFICPHDWHPCAVCESPSLIKSIKEFQKTKMPLAKGEYFPCSKHKPFVCHVCFWD